MKLLQTMTSLAYSFQYLLWHAACRQTRSTERALGLMENGNCPSRDSHRQGRDSSQASAVDSAGQRKHALKQWNLHQCMLSFDYWILWLAMYIGIGSGFTFLNNLGNSV